MSSFGLTKFGRRSESLLELMSEASIACMERAGLNGGERRLDEIVVANMASGEFEGVSGIANALVSELSLEPAYATKVENVSGSGGSALMYAYRAVRTGFARRILVVGGEKMTTLKAPEITSVIASLSHPTERYTGVTLPAYAGLLADLYLRQSGAPRESFAHVAVKNHHNGSLNPYAQFQKEITVEEALQSPIVADPLRLYDFCPVSDGAAAVLLTSEDEASTLSSPSVEILASEGATATHAVSERLAQMRLECVGVSGGRAMKKAGVNIRDVGLMELHDMATILEIVQLEELGVFPHLTGWRAAMEGVTQLTGSLPVNTSGGLKAKGHPIGASGVAQASEVYQQLAGQAGSRQVAVETALSLSMGGFGNNAITTLYRRHQ
ncbi:MAG: thiolase family protein [Candidatus Marsarchaeota archaeon]|nr:thiolase family protein [Candidatus Marsarchaeota archaeon]